MTRDLAPVADIGSLIRLRALAARLRPSIVHGFDTKPSLMAPLLATLTGQVRAVRTINGLGRIFAPGAGGGRLLRLTYLAAQRIVAPASAAIIFQNQSDRDFFRMRGLVADDRAVLIPGSGVDTDAFAPTAVDPGTRNRLRRELGLDGKFVVTCVSRVTRQKGIPTLLAAAAVLAREQSDIVTLLVGSQEGEGSEAVPHTEIDQYAPNVIALGHRPDVAAILAGSDVFVLATAYGEGVPRVLLEAGAMELPLIATRVPGCVDVVEDGRSGILIDPGDVQALVAAVVRLRASAVERRRMGEHARRRVIHTFSLAGVTAAHVSLYERLLKQ